jgi:quinol monooxygenase YgiN
MIIVTGEFIARPDTIAEAIALSLTHVHRSRLEPGCLSHDVTIDAGNPHRLLFVERWADEAALHTHFAVPDSRAFAKALGGLAVGRPSMQIYEATEVKRA